ncbi:MAG: hypothetical protein RLZZ592_3035 [Pseudomonadota bacterium]
MKFSIITATYNSAALVGALAGAIRAQTCGDYEWIVVDGASTDATVERVHQSGVGNLTCLSEPDDGIYAALNKGVDLARGDYLYFIGADDVLADERVLADVAQALHPSDVCLFGDVIDGRGVCFRSRVGWKSGVVNTIHHQGAFYRRDLFDDFRFDTGIKVVADYELNFRLSLWHRQACRRIERLIARCGPDGASNRGGESRNYADMRRLRSRYIGPWRNGLCHALAMANLTLRQRQA